MKTISEYCKTHVKIKIFITLAVILTMCFLAIRREYIPSEFLMIATAVVTYYFCKDDAIEERMRVHEKNFHRQRTRR